MSLSSQLGWVEIQWDHGGVNSYRMGAEGKYDLDMAGEEPAIPPPPPSDDIVEEDVGTQDEEEGNEFDDEEVWLMGIIMPLYMCVVFNRMMNRKIGRRNYGTKIVSLNNHFQLLFQPLTLDQDRLMYHRYKTLLFHHLVWRGVYYYNVSCVVYSAILVLLTCTVEPL